MGEGSREGAVSVNGGICVWGVTLYFFPLSHDVGL